MRCGILHDDESLVQVAATALRDLLAFADAASGPDVETAAVRALPEVDHGGPPDEIALRAIAVRRGQPEFRRRLREYFGDRCVVTGSDVDEILEAAHIDAHADGGDYSVSNGLLLRADIHTLFDRRLLSIDVESQRPVVRLHPSISRSEYRELDGGGLRAALNDGQIARLGARAKRPA